MITKRLTADEVAAKRFTPVRLREGYSMDEVDAFLDEVEGTLTEQEKEIKELQLQVKQGASVTEVVKKGGSADEALLAELNASKERIARLEQELVDAKEAAAKAPAAAPASGLGEAAASATRMLEMAAVQHDEMIAQGRAASEKLIEDARARIAEEEAAATEARRAQIDALESERSSLEGALQGLRDLEASSRSTLQEHFQTKLQELANPVLPASSAGKASKPQPKEQVADPQPEAAVEEAPEETLTSTIPTTPPTATEPQPAPAAEPGPPKAYQEFPSFYGNTGN